MNTTPEAERSGRRRPWYQRIGPGLITACVVIGPGSILTSSKVGASNGYAVSWVVMVAAVFMLTYMQLGAKLGVAISTSTGELVTRRVGRWLAVLLGISIFSVTAAFQFGNNLGIQSAFNVYLSSRWATTLMVVFNGLSILFLFGFRNLYRAIERMMMLFVAVMLVSFAINLGFARPKLSELAAGFVPRLEFSGDDMALLGLVGTTFVIAAAYFQSYLVQQKGWDVEQMRDGLIDARIGAVIMALITLMIMTTAGTVLRGHELGKVEDVAQQLQPLFGTFGQTLFCLGLFSAAYSSFLVNSMIGGYILADGLGLGGDPQGFWPRLFTVAVLLVGMSVGLFTIATGTNPVPAIVVAQAITVIASPLIAAILWGFTSREDVMGELKNGPVANAFAGVGLFVLLAIAIYTATVRIPTTWQRWRKAAAQQATLAPTHQASK